MVISPCPETLKITGLMPITHEHTFPDKWSNTSKQALWEIKQVM